MPARPAHGGPRRLRWPRRATLSWGLLSSVLVGGCAATADDAGPTGVSVSIVQDRLDIARGVMSIKLRNDGEYPVRVTSASYDDARFATPAQWNGESEVPAGSAADLRVDVPAAACDVDGSSAAGTVRVEFATVEGTATVEYPAEDPLDFVAAFTDAACFAEQIAQTATVELTGIGTRSAGDGGVAVLELAITVHGESAITLESVSGTVLLQPASGEAAWRLETTVEPGESTTPELDAVPSRCDAHTLAEDKVGTRFPATVSVLDDQGITGDLMLVATDEQRGELYDYYAARCGLTP